MARRARPGDGSREGRARAEARTRSPGNTRLSTARCSPGLLSQVAQRKEQGEYLGANGTKIFIHPGSGQFKARPAWIVSAEQVQTTKVYARNVARIEPAWVEQVGAHLVKRQHYEPHWERRAARAAIYERMTLFGLTLSSGRSVPYERIDPKAARELFIRHALVLHGVRLARAVPRAQPQAARGHRIPAAEGTARRSARRREPAVRVLRRASARRHLDRRGVRALAPRGRGERIRSCCGSPSATSRPATPSSTPSSFPIISPPVRW